MSEKMTVFFRKKNLEIIRISGGEQNLLVFGSLEEEDAKMIYDYIIVERNEMAFSHMEYFEIYEENNEYKMKIKEECKKKIISMFGNFI